MRDQAEVLRRKINASKIARKARTIAIVSGKGGVGKSNFSVNFSLQLAKKGKKVLLIDMDLGMGNVELILGEPAKGNFVDIFKNGVTIHDIINTGTFGLDYIAGGTGFHEVFQFNEEKLNYFFVQLEMVIGRYDYILFDMGAGVTEINLAFLRSVEDMMIITTPEPTAITDAYSMMKYMCSFEKGVAYYLVVNKVWSKRDGEQVSMRIANAAKHFLQQDIQMLGSIVHDELVMKAVIEQVPFTVYDPKSAVSQAIVTIVNQYLGLSNDNVWTEQKEGFVDKLRTFFLKRK
ncbi:MinD/ParA family protein [Priestia taiwanensis]|uniref:Flagellum site-determining protein YlxH n=1 Tax=Priestia taiwanensis TaxID=1347902 RepID=A0A917ARQ6_9BACI|nr:MinD/ParA family protein [Priestia taiwanensis]MBM7362823.1 flagellar biosynthesis protein FlhG [Priestia taiwanensis]GGE65388.1 flagellum site-determining protein YlxH [Priestia taiwanensis]